MKMPPTGKKPKAGPWRRLPSGRSDPLAYGQRTGGTELVEESRTGSMGPPGIKGAGLQSDKPVVSEFRLV